MTEPRSNPLVALAGQTVVVIGGSSGIGLETGGVFSDYELTDHTKTRRRLSELQGSTR